MGFAIKNVSVPYSRFYDDQRPKEKESQSRKISSVQQALPGVKNPEGVSGVRRAPAGTTTLETNVANAGLFGNTPGVSRLQRQNAFKRAKTNGPQQSQNTGKETQTSQETGVRRAPAGTTTLETNGANAGLFTRPAAQTTTTFGQQTVFGMKSKNPDQEADNACLLQVTVREDTSPETTNFTPKTWPEAYAEVRKENQVPLVGKMAKTQIKGADVGRYTENTGINEEADSGPVKKLKNEASALDVITISGKDLPHFETALQNETFRKNISKGTVIFKKCSKLPEFPEKTTVDRLIISNCTGTTLPENLSAVDKLEIYDCPEINYLPEEICVRQILLENCPNLGELPKKLALTGSLKITGCPKLVLPKNWELGSDATVEIDFSDNAFCIKNNEVHLPEPQYRGKPLSQQKVTGGTVLPQFDLTNLPLGTRLPQWLKDYSDKTGKVKILHESLV